MTLASALLRLLVTAASFVALAALWRYRPELPDLPDSLSSPVTTTLLQQLVLLATWLLAALMLLLLVAQILRRRPVEEGRLDTSALRRRAEIRAKESPRMRPALRLTAVEPMLLVVAPPQAAAIQPTEEMAGNSQDQRSADRPLISLLGPLTIFGGKRSRRGLRARALELIAFLALRRVGAQRDEILEAMWPGEDPKRSRHRLYQAVRDARRLLGDSIGSERDRYWLDRTQVDVDVDELEELLDESDRVGLEDRMPLLENALVLFRDEPLAGSDFPWCEGERRRLRGIHVELLEEVGRERLETGDPRGALEIAERGLAVDLLNEALWRIALEADGQRGLREAIEERYEHLRTLLDERLGISPAPETRRLYLRLLGNN